jgi:hypothetical protein
MTEPRNENDPDRALRETYRAGEHPQPPAALDAQILKAAHEAVTPTRPKPSWWARLAVPVSTFAVVVLATVLVLHMQREISAPPAADETSEVLSAAKPATRPASPPAAAPVPFPAERSVATQSREAAEKPGPNEAANAAAAPAPVPATADAAAPASAAGRQEVTEAPLAKQRARPDQEAVGSVAQPTRSDSAAEPAPSAADAAGKPAAAAGAGVSPEESPQQQVEHIRKLRAEGRIEDAKRALASLRRNHPAFPLPEDLRNWP